MKCEGADRLKEMLVGINVMGYMCVHAFQDILLEVDSSLGLCKCEECRKLEKVIKRAKFYFEMATTYYWHVTAVSEKALGGLPNAEWKVQRV